MNNKQVKLVEAIAGLFPNNVQVYYVNFSSNEYKDDLLLHKHFEEPLSKENWQQLSNQIADFLHHQDHETVYSFFNKTYTTPPAETEWCLSSAKLIKTDDGLPKEIVVFSYELKLLGTDERNKIYRVLENDAFFKGNFERVSSLTKKEKKLMGLLCSGMSSSQIAAALYISVHTVNTHRKSIHKKLATDNIASLLKYAEIFDLFTEKLHA